MSYRFRVENTIHIVSAAIVLMLCSFHAVAQVTQPHRYERVHEMGDEYYTIISLKEEGLALLREKDKFNGNKKQWELILLDTALKEKHLIEFDIEHRYPLIGYEVTPHEFYLLYRTGETTRNGLQLVEFDIEQGKEISRHQIKPELDFRITHFNKVGKSLVLGGYISSDPAILLYDMTTKNIKVVPGVFQKDNELVDLRINQNQTFNTVLIDRSQRSERMLIFKTFDETGKLLLDDIIPIDSDISLQSSISSTLQREDLIILGTWGDKQSKQSTGFFALPVDPFNEQKIRYYQFGELNHFVDYLSPKRAERIRINTKEDVASGRRSSFVSHVMPFKIDERPEGFLLLAEVYNPVTSANPYYSTPYGNPYNTNSYYYNPFWPGYYPGMRMYRPYPFGSNIKNADEIKTYATILVAFDPKGKMLWDHSVKLDDVKKTSLEQVSDFYYDKKNVYFLYKKKSDIKIKKIDTATDTSEELVEKVKLPDPADEIKNEKESEGGLNHWVGNAMYTWGYQAIRNVNHKNDKVRDVFYINKVVIH